MVCYPRIGLCNNIFWFEMMMMHKFAGLKSMEGDCFVIKTIITITIVVCAVYPTPAIF